jgi:hypothetical protein
VFEEPSRAKLRDRENRNFEQLNDVKYTDVKETLENEVDNLLTCPGGVSPHVVRYPYFGTVGD